MTKPGEPTFRPITPKKDPFAHLTHVDQKIAIELRDFGADAVRKLATYPPAQTEYHRTGDLGRKWTTEGPKEEGGGLVERIGNAQSYATYVQGDPDGPRGGRQVPLFKAYGWTNIKDIAKQVWPKYEAAIKRILQKGT